MKSNAAIKTKMGAFTLIEVLIVAAIIALLAGATGGIYAGSLRRSLVQRSAKELLLAAKYARMTAIERQRPCRLRLDRKERQFWLTIEQTDDTTGRTEEVVITNQYSKSRTLKGQVQFDQVEIRTANSDMAAQDDVITFAADGTADMAMIIIGDDKNYFTVLVDQATGKATAEPEKLDRLQTQTIDLDIM